MKKFGIKILYFLLICGAVAALFFALVYRVDPDGYFKNDADSNNPISLMTQYKNHPNPYILIGDSRMNSLRGHMDYFDQRAGEAYFNASFDGASVNEIVDLFWYCDAYAPLQKVYLGISFYNIQDNYMMYRIEKNVELIRNPWKYVFNYKTVLDAVQGARGNPANNEPPPADAPDFPQYADFVYTICAARNGYHVNQSNMLRLTEVAEYCKENRIELCFVTFPYHVSIYENVIKPLDIEGDISEYKAVLSRHARTMDTEFLSDFSMNDDHFTDGFHFANKNRFIDAILTGDDPMVRTLYSAE